MGKIIILDEQTANQIAAGEVVEGPASVVKEMLENAVDAGATQVQVEIRNGGVKLIRVTDNGSGMERDDVELAFERHATSKIRKIADLDAIRSMGFRGEALASIAAVSRLEMITRTADEENGVRVSIEGGHILSVEEAGCPVGTTFLIRDLFFNTPARYKFLKKDATEGAHVADVLERLALAHPDVSVQLRSNGENMLHTPGNGDLASTVYSLYGKETANSLLVLAHVHEGIRVSGFVGRPSIARGNRGRQTVLMNGRFIQNRSVTAALDEAYKTLLMTRQFAFAVLVLDIPPMRVDVNVHPAKLEVRFSEEGAVFSAVHGAVKNALMAGSLAGELAPVEALDSELPTFPEPVQPITEPFPTGLPAERSIGQQHFVSPLSVMPPAAGSLISPAGTLQDLPLRTAEPQPEICIITRKDSIVESPVTSVRHPSFLEMRIVGQLFDSYLVLQHLDEMLLLDQHAAHERIRFEDLKWSLESGTTNSQQLMQPIRLDMSAVEYDQALQSMEDLHRVGFELEAFGRGTLLVRAIPSTFDGGLSVSELSSILSDWPKESNRRQGGISEELLYRISCKGAIKANRRMGEAEIRALLERLSNLENPYTCLHGRPILLRFPRHELEKRFKRIV